MKRFLFGTAVLGFILIWSGPSHSSPPAEVDRITPRQGKAGNIATIHGTNLRGSTFDIKFGQAVATDARNPGNSSDVIKMAVPPRHPGDPNIAEVTVTIDGVLALTPLDGLRFEYIE